MARSSAVTPAEVRVHIRRLILDASVGTGGADTSPESLVRAAREALARRTEWGGTGPVDQKSGLWDRVAGQVAHEVGGQRTMSSGVTDGAR